jgi:type I restriction-modification system DNA methylase subunit
LNTQNSLISQVRTNLEQCGYSNGRLLTDYVYEDSTGKHSVALAGFARPVYDSRTSCISVIQCENLLGAIEEYVNQFRGFGAPVIFACCNRTLQWWNVGTRGAKIEKTVSRDEIEGFFSAHKEVFSPDRIWRAKNLGRVDTKQQLSFVDIGLMPLLEHEMGERLGGLLNRIIGLLHSGFTNGQLKMPQNQRWIFRAGFWLLCAKILKDKGVNGFIRLDIGNINDVFKAVENHYRARELIIVQTKQQAQALKEVAEEVKKFDSLINLTTEAFGYMYENVLVDKKLRAALGIHATPSYLVDYIIWQLWPYIEQITEDKRVVLEPACGHAPFLTAMMRMLRFSYSGEDDFHKYAKQRLIGIEMDSFAREIARLSLTLADVPNPNGWNIVEGDIYQGDTLRNNAGKAMILLCNPPFENFRRDEKDKYTDLNCENKAAEVLFRTLSYLPNNSVFGVILPQGFLYSENLFGLRKQILDDFELSKICILPDNVFAKAGHPSTVLLGRKIKSDKKISYFRVPKAGLKAFRENYQTKEDSVSKEGLYKAENYSFRRLEFNIVWEYCISLRTLGDISDIGRGIEYKSELNIDSKISPRKKPSFQKGFYSYDNNPPIHTLPDLVWLNVSRKSIQNYGSGISNKPKVLVNRIRGGRSPWRLRAWIDINRYPFGKAFLSIIPKVDISLFTIWALANSPLANAYLYDYCERDNKEGILRKVPIPSFAKGTFEKLEGIVAAYFKLMQKRDSEFGIDVRDKAKQLLLSIDAEVMRLYDLPPKMERRILDLFQGIQRKGVDFDFKGYYSEGFESSVPLHEYLSEEYQRSTITLVDEWVKKHQSPEINKVLRKATEAFEEK